MQAYLWRVPDVQGVEEAEVDEAHESGIELHKGQHHTEVNITRQLERWRNTPSVMHTENVAGVGKLSVSKM